MTRPRFCWCAADSLEPFAPDYLRCTACGTLVGQAGLADEETRVQDDELDYYGKRYWLEHQRDELGLPDIHVRARDDLRERCVQWLQVLLRYREPPARVLEIGAGHGAYTALLRFAGYEATALDLSPWVADFARSRFGIPYLVGDIQEQRLEPRSFDVVVANDLLEHLPNPLLTIGHCVDLLKPGGILILQTPETPPNRTYDQLVAEQDAFLEHIGRAASEHLYVFSRNALELLLRRLGVGEVAFEEPPYPYDMLCVASSVPLRRSESEIGELVQAASAWPFVLALIDAQEALRRSDEDRIARQAVIDGLDGALRAIETEKQAQVARIQRGVLGVLSRTRGRFRIR